MSEIQSAAPCQQHLTGKRGHSIIKINAEASLAQPFCRHQACRTSANDDGLRVDFHLGFLMRRQMALEEGLRFIFGLQGWLARVLLPGNTIRRLCALFSDDLATPWTLGDP